MRGGRLIGSTDPPLARYDSSTMAMHDFGRGAIQPLLHAPPGSDTLLLGLDDQLPRSWWRAAFLAMPSTLKRLGVIFASPATTHLARSPSSRASSAAPSLGAYIHLLEGIWAPCLPAGRQADIAQNPGTTSRCSTPSRPAAAGRSQRNQALHYKLYLEDSSATVRWVRLSSDAGHVFSPAGDRRGISSQLFSDPDATVTFQIAVSRPPPPPPPAPPPPPPPPSRRGEHAARAWLATSAIPCFTADAPVPSSAPCRRRLRRKLPEMTHAMPSASRPSLCSPSRRSTARLRDGRSLRGAGYDVSAVHYPGERIELSGQHVYRPSAPLAGPDGRHPHPGGALAGGIQLCFRPLDRSRTGPPSTPASARPRSTACRAPMPAPPRARRPPFHVVSGGPRLRRLPRAAPHPLRGRQPRRRAAAAGGRPRRPALVERSLVGVDHCASALQEARRRLPEPVFTFLEGDLRDPTPTPSYLRHLIAINTLHNPAQMGMRCSKPSGTTSPRRRRHPGRAQQSVCRPHAPVWRAHAKLQHARPLRALEEGGLLPSLSAPARLSRPAAGPAHRPRGGTTRQHGSHPLRTRPCARPHRVHLRQTDDTNRDLYSPHAGLKNRPPHRPRRKT